MTRYVAARGAQGFLVVVLAVVVSFLLVDVAGNPVDALGAVPLSDSQRQALIQEYGYDEPTLERLGSYLGHLVQGDFGHSFRSQESAIGLVLEALPKTVLLVAAAVFFASLVAVPVAMASVLRQGSLFDRLVRRGLIVLQGIPDYWLALVLILVFAVELQALPSIGDEGLESLVLPAAALAIPLISTLVRLMRAQLLEVLNDDFVVALRARGLSPREIMVFHAAPNALPPVVSYFALQLGWLLGGTLIIETIFAWPGIGALAINATTDGDLPVIEAIIVVTAVAYVLFNLVADLLVMVTDPRLRIGRV